MSRYDWWKTGDTPPRYEDPPDPDDDSDADTVPEPTPLVTGDDPDAADLPEPDIGGES